MKRRSKALLLLFLIIGLLLGSVIYIVIAPSKWTQEIVSYFNNSLIQDNSWNLSLGKINGSLYSDIELKDIYLRSTNGDISLYSESIILNLDFSSIFSGSWAFSNISLNGVLCTINSKNNHQKLNKIDFIDRLAKNQLKSKNISINNSSLIVKNENTESIFKFDADGKLYSENDILSFEINKFFVKDYYSENLVQIDKGKIRVSSKDFSLRNIKGKLNKYSISLNGQRNFNPKGFSSFWVKINDISIYNNISEYIQTDSLLFLDFNIQYLDDKINIDGSLNEKLSKRIIANFNSNLNLEKNKINFENSNIKFKNVNLSGEGYYSFDNFLKLDLKIDDLDLKAFNLYSDNTKISAIANINAELNNKFYPINIDSKISAQNNDFGSNNFFSALGKLNYFNSKIVLKDSFVVNFGSGSIISFGEYDINKDQLNLEMNLNETELNNLSKLINFDYIPKSILNGKIYLSGIIKNPSLRGNINFNNIESKYYKLDNLSSTFILNSINKDRHGSLFLNGKNIEFENIRYDDLEMNFYFMGDTIYVAKANLNKGNKNTIFSGEIINFNKINIDQFRSNINDQLIYNLNPFSISYIDNMYNFGSANFKINNGNIEFDGKFQPNKLLAANLNISNFNIETLNSFLIKKIPLSGVLFGKLNANSPNDKININGEIEIKNGEFKQFSFENLNSTFTLENNQFYIEKFKIVSNKELKLDASGYYNTILSSKNPFEPNINSKMNISAYFNKFDLSSIAELFPKWWSLEGITTGSFVVNGRLNSSDINFSLNVINPKFSLLNGNQLNIRGRYNNKRLYFENIIAYTLNGEYTSEGYIPIDLDVISENKNRFINNEPIALKFFGKSRSMELITPYFSNVDSVTGDIDFELLIDGTINKSNRNGFLKLNNGKLFYSHMDLPLSGINGFALIKNNMFIINDFSATSNIPDDTNWGKDLRYNISKATGGRLFKNKTSNDIKNNLSLRGTMDMTSFFNPNLAFILNGKNIYFRSLLGEIEGIGDINLAITGKDTINISGDIIPNEAVLRIEFYDENITSPQISQQGPSINYKLNIPINDKLFIQNSQIDAEVSGNMSIFKNGQEPYSYSGELDVVDGKFYYYSDVFDIQDGNLLFDPTQLNPKLNINAQTSISGEEILVNLSGFLDDPVLVLEHSDNYFSQEDLLQLLTLQKTFNGSADELGKQSAFIFGKFLENELEKNISRSNPIFNEFEIEGSSAIIDPSNNSEVAVKLGTRVTSNLSLSYKKSFSLLKNNELGVEYRLNRNVSLVASYDEDGQVRLKYRRKYKF